MSNKTETISVKNKIGHFFELLIKRNQMEYSEVAAIKLNLEREDVESRTL
jgi:hypothetical protein